jgi:hypothetical protein
LVCHIAAKHNDLALLNDAGAGDETEQRGLAGGLGPIIPIIWPAGISKMTLSSASVFP